MEGKWACAPLDAPVTMMFFVAMVAVDKDEENELADEDGGDKADEDDGDREEEEEGQKEERADF